MATLKQRLHKKNSSGTYDVVHLETSSEVVKRPDGTTVEASLVELKTSVSNGKSAVASAITDKGISTSATATFDTMASNIGKIPQLDTSNANAAAGQILTGYSAYVKGSKINGSMPNHGAVNQTLNASGSYTIPAGYHNGSGKITANSLASQTSATATATDIASGKTAWVNGSKITGTLTTQLTMVNVTSTVTKQTDVISGFAGVAHLHSLSGSNLTVLPNHFIITCKIFSVTTINSNFNGTSTSNYTSAYIEVINGTVQPLRLFGLTTSYTINATVSISSGNIIFGTNTLAANYVVISSFTNPCIIY